MDKGIAGISLATYKHIERISSDSATGCVFLRSMHSGHQRRSGVACSTITLIELECFVSEGKFMSSWYVISSYVISVW